MEFPPGDLIPDGTIGSSGPRQHVNTCCIPKPDAGRTRLPFMYSGLRSSWSAP